MTTDPGRHTSAGGGIVAAVALLVVAIGALAVIGVESPAVFRGMTAGLGPPFAIVALLATLTVAFLL